MENISILLLDNNERFLQSAENFLQGQELIKTVYTTPNDREACRIAEENQPDVILLDVLMPGQNGIDLIPAFRSASPASKIIMLTLWDMSGYRDSAKLAGADEFISKKDMADTLLPAIIKVTENQYEFLE